MNKNNGNRLFQTSSHLNAFNKLVVILDTGIYCKYNVLVSIIDQCNPGTFYNANRQEIAEHQTWYLHGCSTEVFSA